LRYLKGNFPRDPSTALRSAQDDVEVRARQVSKIGNPG